MITRTKISVLAMVLLAVSSVFYMTRVGLHVDALSSTRSASMVVPDTNGLLVGSRVLLRGVPIGHVTDLEPAADGVDVRWNYSDERKIPINSAFRVDNLSALGEAYVSVLPSSINGPFLGDGDVIAREQVSTPTTFKELSEKLTDILGQVDPDQVQGIFSTLDVGLPDDVRVIGDLNRAGTYLADEFTQQQDNLVTLLATLQPLLMRSGDMPENFRATAPLMADFGTGFQDLLNSVRDATIRGPLLAGIRDGASPLFTELQTFLDLTAADLNVIGVNLLPAASAGAASLRTVDMGRMLDKVLAATSPPGAVTITIPAGAN
ncbi:mammalian cell entry protein [Williamsia sp. 1138]|uniref:MlaD family protein n=1 Tax=Williamsia sp. 1138 TaxID=1903117 RepID=UPI000A1048B8|nr:MlaD family protein [Williamsia sp. 1138]OZG30850.1 mammalian cell entry protein [Williamsia sp. 1138]